MSELVKVTTLGDLLEHLSSTKFLFLYTDVKVSVGSGIHVLNSTAFYAACSAITESILSHRTEPKYAIFDRGAISTMVGQCMKSKGGHYDTSKEVHTVIDTVVDRMNDSATINDRLLYIYSNVLAKCTQVDIKAAKSDKRYGKTDVLPSKYTTKIDYSEGTLKCKNDSGVLGMLVMLAKYFGQPYRVVKETSNILYVEGPLAYKIAIEAKAMFVNKNIRFYLKE